MKGQDKEKEAHPNTGVTFAASLGFVMKVLELEAQNPESEIQPISDFQGDLQLFQHRRKL
jgi:hypothetical protein